MSINDTIHPMNEGDTKSVAAEIYFKVTREAQLISKLKNLSKEVSDDLGMKKICLVE